jgi:hypothetical protein
MVRSVDGSVIEYVYVAWPLTVKVAAVTVPAVVGSVTPPVAERTPPGVMTTVPPLAVWTATLPKFMSNVFEMLMGVTIVAEALAVADVCANAPAADAVKKIARSVDLRVVLFFILLFFLCQMG